MQYFQELGSESSALKLSSLPSAPRGWERATQQTGRAEVNRSSKQPEKSYKKKDIKITSQGHLRYGGHLFASRSEAACAILLEKYIPGFKIKDGVNFQVPIGASDRGHLRTVDFMVDGVLVEYHPPRLYKSSKKPGDFKSWDEYDSYRALLKRCNEAQKETLKTITEIKLTRHYTEKRLSQIAESPEHGNKELIVVTSDKDFYEKVLKRFGGPDLPEKEVILREFRIATRKPTEISKKRKKHASGKAKGRGAIRSARYQGRRRA